MLVLSRMRDEEIVVGGGNSGFPEIVITLVELRGNKARIGIDAPTEIPVHRREVADAIARDGEDRERAP